MSDKDSYQYMKPAPFATIALQDDVSILSEFTGVTPFPAAPHDGSFRGAEPQPIGHGGVPVQRPDMPVEGSTVAPAEAFRKPVLYSAPPQESRSEWQPTGRQGDQVSRPGMVQDDSSTPAPAAFKVVPSAPPHQFRSTENQPNGDKTPVDYPGSQSAPLQKLPRPNRRTEKEAEQVVVLPMRSSRQPQLMLKEESTTKTSHDVKPKQPSSSSNKHLIQRNVTIEPVTSCHHVQLDEEAASVWGDNKQEVEPNDGSCSKEIRGKMAGLFVILCLGVVLLRPFFVVLFG